MVLTYPKIICHSYDLLKFNWDFNGHILVKTWLHWAPTGQRWKIVFPICITQHNTVHVIQFKINNTLIILIIIIILVLIIQCFVSVFQTVPGAVEEVAIQLANSKSCTQTNGCITRMHGKAQHDGHLLGASKLQSYFSLFVDKSTPGPTFSKLPKMFS